MRQRQRSASQARPPQAAVPSTPAAGPAQSPGEAELELRLATTLAPILFGVATFSAAAVSGVGNPKNTPLDEFLSVIAAICIFSASLLLDAAFDKQKLGWARRWTHLGGGYVFFCLVVGLTAVMIPVLYDAKRAGDAGYGWHNYWVLFIGAGGAIFAKMMTPFGDVGNTLTTSITLLFFVLSVAALIICNPDTGVDCRNRSSPVCIICYNRLPLTGPPPNGPVQPRAVQQ